MIGRANTTSNLHKPLLLLALIVLMACRNNGSQDVESETATEVVPIDPIAATLAPTTIPTAVPPTAPPPTPTPQLAALVNGQPILLEDLERELTRYELAQAELGNKPGAEEKSSQNLVLDALIERELIRQAGSVFGITILPDLVDLKLSELREAASKQGNFDDWLAANQWTPEEFRSALEAEMLVEEMVAIITADVPLAMEQVHARYIQLDDFDQAQSLLSQIHEGKEFAGLAQQYSLDQVTAQYEGDLGFFARGSLLVTEVEEVAFGLEPEEVSDIITVTDPDSGQVTYYIVQLIERDASRMLGADLRYRLLQETFETWLEEQKAGATITYLLDD